MDFRFDEKAKLFREEIRAWVKENIPPSETGNPLADAHADETWAFSMSISKKLSEKGWLTLN